jgi:hypothetical protein
VASLFLALSPKPYIYSYSTIPDIYPGHPILLEHLKENCPKNNGGLCKKPDI